jgi:putative phosphoesterase
MRPEALPDPAERRYHPGSGLRVAVVSDSHGLLRPEVTRTLAGVDHILHAGDVGTPGVLAALERIAPVTAVRGNVDHGPWATALPDRVQVELGGARFLVLHRLEDLGAAPAGVTAVVYGHSHRPAQELRQGVLYLNPGSIGPRRFRLPVAWCFLDVRDGRLEVEPRTLGGEPGGSP